MAKSQLHEVLAVEGDLEATWKKVLKEATDTFEKRAAHFTEGTRRVEMNDENRSHENVSETSPMVETVLGKLKYIRGHGTRYFNAFAAKERTNQTAASDIVVDGNTLLEAVPATALLGLEKRLASLRDVYSRIPTLDPGIKWQEDPAAENGVYVCSEDEVRFKTEKTIHSKVLYEATKEHPAQIEKWAQDTPVGRIVITRRCSMLSPADKSKYLGRIDTLIRAVKKARQRANKAEVIKTDLAAALFNFIHQGE